VIGTSGDRLIRTATGIKASPTTAARPGSPARALFACWGGSPLRQEQDYVYSSGLYGGLERSDSNK